MVAFLIALLPSAGVLFIFWIGIKALLEADRRERAAQARIEAAEDRDNQVAQPGVPISSNDAGAATDSPGEG